MESHGKSPISHEFPAIFRAPCFSDPYQLEKKAARVTLQVYLEPVHLGWKPLVQSWAENFKKKRPGRGGFGESTRDSMAAGDGGSRNIWAWVPWVMFGEESSSDTRVFARSRLW